MRGRVLFAAATLAFTLAGCCSCPEGEAPNAAAKSLEDFRCAPDFRVCCVFGHDLRAVLPFVYFENTIQINELRGHSYGGAWGEDNGILYTRRGGFLDTGHLRDYVDWTAWVAAQIKRHYRPGSDFSLPAHGARQVRVRLDPGNRPGSDELFIRLAQRVVFEFSVWHEIATWYGWRLVALYPEKLSAFSPEDIYSNALGVHVGGQVLRSYLRQGEKDYGPLVDGKIAGALKELGATSRQECKRVLDLLEGVEGWWDKSKLIPQQQLVCRRFVEFGETTTPWLPPLPATRSLPATLTLPQKAPLGDDLHSYYTLEITPDYDSLPRMAKGPKRFTPADFPGILEHVRQEVRREFGPLGDTPWLGKP